MLDLSYIGRCPFLKTLIALLIILIRVVLQGLEVELEGPLVVEIEYINLPMI